MIVAFHLSYLYSSVPDYIHKLTQFGGKWIVVFFIISAYTITASVQNSKYFSWAQYFRKRFVRIAPPYYFMLTLGIFVIIFTQNSYKVMDMFIDFIRHVLFINMNPFDSTNQNTFLGIEWYIPVQFWLYGAIPLVIYFANESFIFIPIIFLLSIILHFYPNLLYEYQGKEGFYWTVQNFLMFYVMGSVVQYLSANIHGLSSKVTKKHFVGIILIGCVIGYYLYFLKTGSEKLYALILLTVIIYKILQKYLFTIQLLHTYISSTRFMDSLLIIALIGIYLKYVNNFYYVKNSLEFMGLWIIALLLVCTSRTYIVRKIFENRFIIFIGKISYGIYLSHYLIMTIVGYYVPTQNPFLRTAIIIPITICFSYFLENFISKKFTKKLFNFPN